MNSILEAFKELETSRKLREMRSNRHITQKLEEATKGDDAWKKLGNCAAVVKFCKGMHNVFGGDMPNPTNYYKLFTKNGEVFYGKGQGDSRQLKLVLDGKTTFGPYDINDKPVKDSLIEDVESSMPVHVLPKDEIREFIENIPETSSRRPPYHFSVGYIKELGQREIPARFRGGRGSDGEPRVRIFKCSEMTVYTGDYESLGATKAMRRATGRERVGDRTGFTFSGDASLGNKIGTSASGEEQLQCYIKAGTQPKSKYFISLDGEDLHEISKRDVIQYLTPAEANKIINGRENDQNMGKPTVRLKLSGIYKIGNLGRSIMR